MIRSRTQFPFAVLAALSLASTPVLAQRVGGSPPAQRSNPVVPSAPAAVAQAHQASGSAWNGRQPTWGGSPVRQRGEHERREVVVPVYVPVYSAQAVAAPAPVAVPVIVDTVYSVYQSAPSAEMRVAAPPRRELTTIETYRLQPRFQKP